MRLQRVWVRGGATLFGAVALLLTAPVAAQPAPPAPGTAPAQPSPAPLSESLTGEAKADYDLGKLLFTRGDYGNALLKFRHAHELASDPRLLWNIAACETKLHHYARTLSVIERLKNEGAQVLSAADLQAMDALEKASRALVCTLQLTVSEAGAQVLIDDEPVGITPLQRPVLVDAGTRRIRVSKRGFKDQVRTEQVDGGTQREISLRLERDIHEGRLIVQASPDASVALDGKVVGVGRWEGLVASGGHTLRVTAEGMAPYQSEVLVQDNQVRSLQIDLTPAEPSRGVPTWLWIAGGVVLAAGAVTLGAVVLSPDPEPPIQGSVGLTYASFRGW